MDGMGVRRDRAVKEGLGNAKRAAKPYPADAYSHFHQGQGDRRGQGARIG